MVRLVSFSFAVKHWLTLLLFVATAVAWGIGWRTRTHLSAELTDRPEAHRALSEARREHERLLRLQPATDEWERLHTDAAELVCLRIEVSQHEQVRQELIRKAETLVRGLGVFPLATWVPTSALKNYGRATPQSVLQTALGAAAGGDLDLLKDSLAFDPETRKAADKLLAQLPEAERSRYREPELLIALFTAKNVPTEVQLVSEHMQGADDAMAYLALKTAGEKPSMISLRMHRSSDGWRLMVPANAVEKVGQELSGSTPLPIREVQPPRIPE